LSGFVTEQSRRDALAPAPHVALMATWEITITCQDGSRLHFSELRGRAPKKDEIIETADAGKMIKARIDAYREERQAGGGSRSPFFKVTAIRI
jgi:hypothetical protein